MKEPKKDNGQLEDPCKRKSDPFLELGPGLSLRRGHWDEPALSPLTPLDQVMPALPS